MSKIKVSEIFLSVQGEALWTGVPSVFIRTFGCNFSCRGFSMPLGELSEEPEQIAKNIDQYKSYDDLPLAHTGCDSYAAWHPAFKHLSPMLTIDELVSRTVNLLPNQSWVQPNGQDYHLIITGGEPLLGWQKSYVHLFNHPLMKTLKNITFETNTTQSLHPALVEFLKNSDIHVTWSCSPKLSVSGEPWKLAIKPDILKEYLDCQVGGGSSLYLKFVVANQKDLDDVNRAVTEYRNAGINCPVYLMPVGGTTDNYYLTNTQVADLAIKSGYRYSARLQIDLFGNQWGT